MTLHIRTGLHGELGAVLALWSRSGAEPTRTDDLASLRTLSGRDPGSLLVAVDDGDLVGSVIAGWDGWRGSVYRLVVDPTRRHRGIGTRLVRAAEHRL
jgi:ribosomal protein S18 acetylase RimI-like enzyme